MSALSEEHAAKDAAKDAKGAAKDAKDAAKDAAKGAPPPPWFVIIDLGGCKGCDFGAVQVIASDWLLVASGCFWWLRTCF